MHFGDTCFQTRLCNVAKLHATSAAHPAQEMSVSFPFSSNLLARSRIAASDGPDVLDLDDLGIGHLSNWHMECIMYIYIYL